MTRTMILFGCLHARTRTKSVNHRLESKVLLTIPKANGHPTPNLYGNKRGGIPLPKNSRATYIMLL